MFRRPTAIAIGLCFLGIAHLTWGTIAGVGSLGGANSTSSGTTLAVTTSADLEVNNVALVFTAFDNNGTTDADHSEVSGVADSVSNTYTKVCEFTNGEGSAAAGVTVSLWMTRATTQLDSAATITITYANTITSKAAEVHEFTVGAALELANCQTAVGDGGSADPPSMTISGQTSQSYLFFRVGGKEGDSPTAAWTPTSGYAATAFELADTGTGSTSIKLDGEFLVLTATGDTSDPSDTGDADNANVYAALNEQGTTRRPIGPIILQ